MLAICCQCLKARSKSRYIQSVFVWIQTPECFASSYPKPRNFMHSSSINHDYRLRPSSRACRSSSAPPPPPPGGPPPPPPMASATRPSGTAFFWRPEGVSPICKRRKISQQTHWVHIHEATVCTRRHTACPKSTPISSSTSFTTSSPSSSSSKPVTSSIASSIISCL